MAPTLSSSEYLTSIVGTIQFKARELGPSLTPQSKKVRRINGDVALPPPDSFRRLHLMPPTNLMIGVGESESSAIFLLEMREKRRNKKTPQGTPITQIASMK